MWVYIQSETAGKNNCIHDLFTVGFYKPDGKFEPESDHKTREEAAQRVSYLNGNPKND